MLGAHRTFLFDTHHKLVSIISCWFDLVYIGLICCFSFFFAFLSLVVSPLSCCLSVICVFYYFVFSFSISNIFLLEESIVSKFKLSVRYLGYLLTFSYICIFLPRGFLVRVCLCLFVSVCVCLRISVCLCLSTYLCLSSCPRRPSSPPLRYVSASVLVSANRSAHACFLSPRANLRLSSCPRRPSPPCVSVCLSLSVSVYVSAPVCVSAVCARVLSLGH